MNGLARTDGRGIAATTLRHWNAKARSPLVRIIALFDPGIRGFLNDIGRKVKLSSEKAERLLGWEARPVEETIVECAQSLVEREKRGA